MKFETLKSFNKKKLIIPTIIISCLIIVVTIFVSQAKYISKDSITIIDDEVNYKLYDFKIIGIYQEKENCTGDNCYEEKEVMPSEGYEINQEKSYCYKDNESVHEEGIILKTNEKGEHVIGNLSKRSKCYLYFDKIKPASEKTFDQLASISCLYTGLTSVIDQNGFTSVDTSKSSCKVYETEDNDGTSYYYRGDVQDNYVKFGKTGLTENGTDIWWRIIRINGDGSIRMIYAGIGNEVPDQRIGKTTTINNSASYKFNNSSTNNMYVGFEYASGIRNGTSKSEGGQKSNALQQLEIWFEQNLNDEFIVADSKIDRNAGFCGDRSAYDLNYKPNNALGIGSQETNYGAKTRNHPNGLPSGLDNPAKPTFTCPDIENDLYTYAGSNKGTQSLKYPIGLITADEVIYAGGLDSESNTSYYLYNNALYWTLSPADFWGTQCALVYLLYSDGSIIGSNTDYQTGLRPVINLTPNSIISGTGTSLDPFKTF